MRSTRGFAAVALACATAAAIAGTALAATGSPALVKVSSVGLGKILVDGRGHTLYLFMHDKSTKSTCYGNCASFWPPLLTTGRPKAGTGANAALLGTTRRTDGKLQVTYHGHPLYFYAKDTKAGMTTGESLDFFGGEWYAVSSAGVKVVKPAPATTTTGYGYGSSGSGYGTGG